MNRAYVVGVCVAALFLASCGDTLGPVESGSLSVLVDGITESDITAGVLYEDENIATQSGNPWGEFITRARGVCGADPTGFTVTGVTARITSTSNVSGFQDFASGPMVVYFQDVSGSDLAATRVDLASSSGATGTGPVTLTVAATRSTLATLRARLVGGDFHLGWRAPTTKTAADNFSVDIRVDFNVRAHCD